jgi:hypothetical protein
MSDKNNIVELADYSVEISEKLTWGMQEQIRATMYGGLKVTNVPIAKAGDLDAEANVEFNASAITNSKYKAIEVCVKKITAKDGKEIPFTKEWLNELSVEDGDKLYAAVNAVTNPKKK